MIIDSHCHLEYEPMGSNLDEVIERALKNNVKYLLSISTTNESYTRILKITEKYPNIYGSYGIHPHETKDYKNLNEQEIIQKISLSKKIIGIGETGLDYYYNHSDRLIQKKIFSEHIKAAQKLNLPLIIHSRSAEEDTYQIIKNEKKNKDFKALIHCFTGSKEFAHKLIDLGCYISASGVVTFKNSKDLADTFLSLPNNRILVETDSPYLSPEPLRGKPNEPSHIVHTVNFLSKIKNIDPTKFAEITSSNFFKLFGQLN
ncbi:TatD family hydrolase [Pelagibacteraceae bacterium]|jgi:TatD DNase family protein|nr:TatD family hydrolase [Pelagibacteraceae bacterium]